jgi:phage tail-like protein
MHPLTNDSVAFNPQVGMNHMFRVSIDHGKWNLGSWSKVSGLSVSWAAIEYRSGDRTDVWACPGNTKYQQLSLSRAACKDSRKVQEWLIKTSRDHAPLTAQIDMVGPDGDSVVSWKFKACFPIAWKLTEFDAAAGKPAIESLDMLHNGFLDDVVDLARKGSS